MVRQGTSFWKAGFYASDITPPAGIHLAGFALRRQGCLGVLDRLYARALCLDDGHRRCLLISCDVLGFDAHDAEAIRAALSRKTGIPVSHILLAATHTHSGPAIMRTHGIGERDPEFCKWLFARILETGHQASRRLFRATLELHRGTIRIGINRRGSIPPGSIHPVPDPDGPYDDILALLHVKPRNRNSTPIVAFHCACHPTVLGETNRHISADFPGQVIGQLRKAGFNSLFFNGAAGNINPRATGSYREVEATGKAVARQILALLQHPGETLLPELHAENRVLPVRYAELPSLQTCERLIRDMERQRHGAAQESERLLHTLRLQWVRNMRAALEAGRLPSRVEAPLQVIGIGALRLAALPFEVFAETALALYAASRQPLWVCGYANGNFGYLPPADAFEQGGYEVAEAYKFYNHPAPFAPEAEAGVRQCILEMVQTGGQSTVNGTGS